MLTVEEYMALRRLIDSERESEGSSLGSQEEVPKPNCRKLVYSSMYRSAFKKIAPRYQLKTGKWKKGGFKAAVKAAHKAVKK